MTGRDRIVLIGFVMLAVIAGGWMLVVSPERKKAEKVNAQVAGAQSQLSAAESQLASAKAAQAQYPAAYASVVSLGKAVPAEQEVPSLIYELELASNRRNVSFNSIVAGGGSGASGSSSATAAAPAATSAALTQMPFTFVFSGGFFSLEHLFRQVTSFTTHTGSGALTVSGRLLTIQSVKLAPESAATPGSKQQKLTGTITASAYVLPASQGLTAGATPASPTGAAAPSAASGTATSSPTPPAIARVTP
jgi:Type II secretion system (T2SS), protein M